MPTERELLFGTNEPLSADMEYFYSRIKEHQWWVYWCLMWGCIGIAAAYCIEVDRCC